MRQHLGLVAVEGSTLFQDLARWRDEISDGKESIKRYFELQSALNLIGLGEKGNVTNLNKYYQNSKKKKKKKNDVDNIFMVNTEQ